jgi:hypothetical protein
MKTKWDSSSELAQRFHTQVARLWPVLKGSLAQVAKPCIRPSCPACARGDKHPAWIFSYTVAGQRRCLYVPPALVPLLRQGLKNGRRLEQWLYRMGLTLVKTYRREQKKLGHALKAPPKS